MIFHNIVLQQKPVLEWCKFFVNGKILATYSYTVLGGAGPDQGWPYPASVAGTRALDLVTLLKWLPGHCSLKTLLTHFLCLLNFYRAPKREGQPRQWCCIFHLTVTLLTVIITANFYRMPGNCLSTLYISRFLILTTSLSIQFFKICVL